MGSHTDFFLHSLYIKNVPYIIVRLEEFLNFLHNNLGFIPIGLRLHFHPLFERFSAVQCSVIQVLSCKVVDKVSGEIVDKCV